MKVLFTICFSLLFLTFEAWGVFYDFEDKAQLKEWEIIGGEWKIENGTLKGDKVPAAGGFDHGPGIVVGEYTWTDNEGFIGELLTIRAICRDPRPAGHCLINLGTHLFDITRFFGGDVSWLFGHLTVGGRDITVEDIKQAPGGFGLIAGDKASVYLAFKNGATATVEYWMAQPQYFGIQLIGTSGCLTIRQPEQPCPMMYRKDALWSSDSTANEWKEVELPPETLAKLASNRWNSVYRMAVEEFVRCIETGEEHPTSGRQAREALELIMGAYESHRRKARVSIPLDLREHPLALWSKEAHKT